MNKVTKEEMLERLDEIIKWFPRYQSPALQERRDEIDDAIRRLIENMDKKPEVSKEFMEKWAKEFSGFTESYDTEILLEKILTELDHEVERKEATNE